MQTFKLWLENDPDIPEFRTLCYKTVEVEIKDVIENGIHPWGDHQYANRTLVDKFIRVIDSEAVKIKEIAEFKYCEDVKSYTSSYHYPERSRFESLLSRISQGIRFVDNVTYLELLKLAKTNLARNWDHKTAKRLVHQVYYGFNQIRSFIKSINPKVKLSSYDDLDKYDLGEILKLEDFDQYDQILISQGLPVTNFRSTTFIKNVTNERGLLRLADSIDHFELQPENRSSIHYENRLRYTGQRRKSEIRLIPHLTSNPEIRTKAKRIAQKHQTSGGKYCFTTSIEKLQQIITDESFRISFPGLDYTNPKKQPNTPNSKIFKNEIKRYTIGKYITLRATGDTIKSILKSHGVSMTGTKEKLLEKLAKLAAKLYQEYKPEMDNYFRNNRFVKIQNGHQHENHQFPILHNLNIKNLVLTMYTTRHSRGNTILTSKYENDTYNPAQLAKTLISQEINPDRAYIKIEQ